MIPEIIKNGTITIESIFDLSDGFQISELLRECRLKNCTVRFENENLTITPADQDEPGIKAKVSTYIMIIQYPQAAMDYLRYKHNENRKFDIRELSHAAFGKQENFPNVKDTDAIIRTGDTIHIQYGNVLMIVQYVRNGYHVRLIGSDVDPHAACKHASGWEIVENGMQF